TVDADLRARFEFRHGFKTLFPDSANPAAFVVQRTRLKIGHKGENVHFFTSLQNIRVWGDVSQLNSSDVNGVAVHEAWAKISFNENIGLKVGRQELNYDDARILGNVDWAMQGRSHDAALLRFSDNDLKIDAGVAFNQDGQSLVNTTLINPGTYKSLQFLWAHLKREEVSVSVLALNNGLQFIDPTDADQNEVRYSQTVGTHIKLSRMI
ncbi:MAG: alginate export family protein, partial [Flavobacteriales bacterium]|nr:alginate export family protein [Flavobacteriales bacterium]